MATNEIQVILPDVDTDEVSIGLRHLTETLDVQGYPLSGGILGGEFGYGTSFENDVFMMHPYCWCEQDDCGWCAAGCTCNPDDHHYFNDANEEVDGDIYFTLPDDQKYHTFTGEVCAYCRGEITGNPNFFHKPSNSKVAWYKYIGRGMQVELTLPWATILQECLQSLEKV